MQVNDWGRVSVPRTSISRMMESCKTVCNKDISVNLLSSCNGLHIEKSGGHCMKKSRSSFTKGYDIIKQFYFSLMLAWVVF